MDGNKLIKASYALLSEQNFINVDVIFMIALINEISFYLILLLSWIL